MRRRLLRLLHVRERPDPPPGSGTDLAVFRASPRYLYLSALTWARKQLFALAGLVFALMVYRGFESPFVSDADWSRFVEFLEGIQLELGGWSVNAVTAFYLFELAAVAAFAVQLVVSGAALYLSWQVRWYMVGDQALRIREGLWIVREQTITIANVQKMSVRQGPLQKLFGIADLEVHTAGGGSGAKSDDSKDGAQPLHVARFRGLEDADGLRDRIQARLVLHKGTGLGDADEAYEDDPAPARDAGDLAAAARELLEETRSLRRALSGCHGEGGMLQ